MSARGVSIILENPADALHKSSEFLVCSVVFTVAIHNSVQCGGYPLYWCFGVARVARSICNIWYSSRTFHLYYASPIGYRGAGFTLQVSSPYPVNQQFLLPVMCSQYNVNPKYSGITSIKSPPFCMTPSSASLTNLTALLPQSRDCSCYVSRPLLAPAPLRMQKHADVLTYAHTIPRTVPTCDISLGSLKLETLWNYSCYIAGRLMWMDPPAVTSQLHVFSVYWPSRGCLPL